MELSAFQAQIDRIYGAQDRARGPAVSYLWFVEEVGELAEELRHAIAAEQETPEHGPPEAHAPAGPLPEDAVSRAERRRRLEHEFGDVLAWLCTLANMMEIDLQRAASRYAEGCPRCGATPCACG